VFLSEKDSDFFHTTLTADNADLHG
jgi:hypothetical protein